MYVELEKPFKNGSSSVITIILTTLTEIAIQSVIKSFHKFTSHFHKLCVILNLIQTNLCWMLCYIYIKLYLCDLRLQWQKPSFFFLYLALFDGYDLAWLGWQTYSTHTHTNNARILLNYKRLRKLPEQMQRMRPMNFLHFKSMVLLRVNFV